MYTRIVQQAIELNYKMVLTEQHEWRSDYPWFIRRIYGDHIVDLGFMAHTFFTKILLEYGFAVTGVDFSEPGPEEQPLFDHRFTFVKSSVDAIPLGDASASTIVAPSLLEHLGLGFYGDTPDDRAAESALAEWHRVLQPGGRLLGQVPYGSTERILDFRGRPYYRIYTATRLERHLRQYTVDEIAYHTLEPHGWIEVSQSVADHIDHLKPFPPCLAKFSARKPLT
jgi:SAM-dependent methyltransferase